MKGIKNWRELLIGITIACSWGNMDGIIYSVVYEGQWQFHIISVVLHLISSKMLMMTLYSQKFGNFLVNNHTGIYFITHTHEHLTVGKDEFCDTNHLIETILHVVLRVIMPFDFGDNHFASVYCKNKKNTFFFFCFNRIKP